MRILRWVLPAVVGIGVWGIVPYAEAYTEHTFPGILCVISDVGQFYSGTIKRASSMGSQNASQTGSMLADCPMTRKDGASTSWITAEVTVRNTSTTSNLTCTLYLWDGYGDDVQAITAIAPPNNYWTLQFTNPNPSQYDYKDYYTIDCNLPAATGMYYYNRSEVISYWLRQP